MAKQIICFCFVFFVFSLKIETTKNNNFFAEILVTIFCFLFLFNYIGQQITKQSVSIAKHPLKLTNLKKKTLILSPLIPYLRKSSHKICNFYTHPLLSTMFQVSMLAKMGVKKTFFLKEVLCYHFKILKKNFVKHVVAVKKIELEGGNF
jgi:uncharacterized membrane protein